MTEPAAVEEPSPPTPDVPPAAPAAAESPTAPAGAGAVEPIPAPPVVEVLPVVEALPVVELSAGVEQAPAASTGPAMQAAPAALGPSLAGRDGSPTPRAANLLDRLDDAALPTVFRILDAARSRLADTADREACRARRLADRARRGRVGGDGPADAEAEGSPALLDVVGVAPGGVVDRGARVLVLGLVALIVVSAAAAMLQSVDRDRPSNATAPTDAPAVTPPPAQPVAPTVTIGPGAHDSVAEYLGASQQNLASLTAAAPAADLYAVASLAAPVTPDQMLDVLGTYRAVQVFFTAGSGGEVEQATVRDPVADVHAAFASAAAQAQARAAAEAKAGEGTADDRDRQAAAQLRAGCACLFAAVVRAPAGRLSQLAADPRVRVVDPAPPGAGPPAVRFLPLLPDRR
ncbi:hypothetical protein [Frankia sp. QA3]|uniref:hypothetical protein n=1 Tax=Frankia sp. QA3 TaxID=710111 RepID=UPI000269CAC7|nr:hypothetical protein [Frankia sp. QA3]EIV93163.1 hypothetical protein FraQA3DRAFT_2843 [Frankia sp. QA3]